MTPKSCAKEETQQPDAKQSLGDLLRACGLVSKDQIQIALHEQRKTNERIGEVLRKLGFLSEADLAQALALQNGYDYIDLSTATTDERAHTALPADLAVKLQIFPVTYDGSTFQMAMSDPFDINAIDEARRYLPRHTKIVILVASKTAILNAHCGRNKSETGIEPIVKELQGENTAPLVETENWRHPIIRLVDRLLTDAVREGASDIHLEPENSFVRLRIRVDGVLHQKHALHISHWPQLSHRLKILSDMNIADTRSMQDGNFHKTIDGEDIDFRTAIMPTAHGENIVIRILDRRRALLPLEELGYDKRTLQQMKFLMERPEGIVLVTGPTGSGKTTTLYAMLKRLSSPHVNIMTLEDPIEYQFDLIRQTAISEQQGITFADGVRGILRQAPDIVFIGEIRDDDTAKMALRAAMTGHQVFSTLHCNNVFGAFARLNDLGLSSRMLAENISGVIAQRLVRKLCTKCKTSRPATADETAIIERLRHRKISQFANGFSECQAPFSSQIMIADSVGCNDCRQTGYKGRCAITEVLRSSPQIDELISNDASQSTIRSQARSEGFVSMAENGILKVLAHETSLCELRRNVDMTRMD